MSTSRPFVLALLCALLPQSLPAAEHDFHTWGAVVASGALVPEHPSWRYWLEGQGRFDDDSTRFNQGIVRGAIGHALGERAVLWAGYALIPTHPRGRGNDSTEHRAWQQLTWRAAQPFAGWTLSTRSRLEQRFVDTGDDTGWRARHLFKLTHELGDDGRCYLALWDEIFVHLNDTDWGAASGFDQNRAFAGLGLRLAPSVITEIGYLHQYVDRQRRAAASNHVLSLTVFLNF